VVIALFFILHWQISVFFQTFFLHRYGAHRMFKMSKGWERFFHLCTYLTQGSSYLSPRAYAILHRMHHAYSDTEKDPHSPIHSGGLFPMMSATWVKYSRLKSRKDAPDPRFDGGYPEWRFIDDTLATWPVSIAWGALYVLFYVEFATAWWMFLLLPFHFLMGPTHGAIVNWCGHKYGYKNFENGDVSKNTLVFDVLTMGELFQNNHHKYGMSPTFAARWFEIDPAYQVMRVLSLLKIIDLSGSQTMRWEPSATAPAAPARSLRSSVTGPAPGT
jgi:stearoyl-CoA desaturase (delta-9 desaturase)